MQNGQSSCRYCCSEHERAEHDHEARRPPTTRRTIDRATDQRYSKNLEYCGEQQRTVGRWQKYVRKVGAVHSGPPSGVGNKNNHFPHDVRLFKIAPGAVKLFPKFADVELEDLEKDESYRSHALSVMQAVQLAVSSIDDLDGLFSTLKDLGTVHTGLGIQDIHFLVSLHPI